MADLTPWNIFGHLWKKDGDASYLQQVAEHIGIPPGRFEGAMNWIHVPAYVEAVKMLDWMNKTFLPQHGFNHRYTLCDLWPHIYPRPGLLEEIKVICGMVALQGATKHADEIEGGLGKAVLNAVKKRVKSSDGRYPVLEVYKALDENPDIDIETAPGNPVFLAKPKPVSPPKKVGEKAGK